MDLRQELLRAARRVAERGLVWASAGNISVRLAPECFLISASGKGLGELTLQDLVMCSLSSDSCAGSRRPSTETPVHRAIYQVRPEVQAILHFASFYATLIACSDLPVPTDITPEAMGYLGSVVRVPYHHPGSQALVQAVVTGVAQADVLLLNNHGPLCLGTSLPEVVLRAEALEQLCHLLACESLSQGTLRLQRLGQETQQDFREYLRSRGV